MTEEIWESSSEDVRERWRDIARALRDSGDAEAIPRALQVCFWFGADASGPGAGPRSEATLLHLLPPTVIARLRQPRSGPAAGAPRSVSPRRS